MARRTWHTALAAVAATLMCAGATYAIQGDTCADPFVISGNLPITATGSVTGFANDYDPNTVPCTGHGLDVVYSYTPAYNQLVTIDLSSTAGDPVLYIFAAGCANPPLFCDEDSGPGSTAAQLSGLTLNAGTTYFIVVDGEGTTAIGNYTLSITGTGLASLSLSAQPGPDPLYPACYDQGANQLVVDVNLNASVAILSSELRIKYDAAKLSTSVAQVAILTPFESADPNGPFVDDPNGIIRLSLYDGPTGGVAGMLSGTMARITFNVDAEFCPTSGLVWWEPVGQLLLTDSLSGVYQVASGNLSTSDLGSISSDSTAPTLSGVPGNVTVPNDPGLCSYTPAGYLPPSWTLYDDAAIVATGNPNRPYALELRSVTGEPDPDWGSGEWLPSGPLTFAGITNLSASYSMQAGCFGGGAPRFGIGLDGPDPDNLPDGYIFAYFGTPPNYLDCPPIGAWFSTGEFINLADPTVRWDLTQFAGPFYATYAQALAGFGAFNVTEVILALDGAWLGPQVMWFDQIVVNNTYNFSFFGAPGATDNCCLASLTATRSDALPLSAPYPVGNTVVTWTATDCCGNVSTASYTVTVVDVEVPLIAPIPVPPPVPALPGQCGAPVFWPIPTTSDNCGVVSFGPINPAHVPGAFFPVGTTVVTYQATDAAGNSSTYAFPVTVLDLQPPIVTCPANITQNVTSGCSKSVTFAATATDNCPGTITLTYSPASGFSFPVGTTVVTCTAKDVSNNTATCTFTVTIVDNILPTITCPSTYVVDANVPGTGCAAQVTWGNPTVSDNCAGVTSVCSPPSGSIFPPGNTTVTCTAIDASGNTKTCSFVVTVTGIDTTPPVVTCPANVTVALPANATQCGTNVNWASLPTATDNCGVTSFFATHADGGFYPVGTTTVTVTAKDAANNSATCSFTVTVNDATGPAPVIPCPSDTTLLGCAPVTHCWTRPTFSDVCGAPTVTVSTSPNNLAVTPDPLDPSKDCATFLVGVTETVTYTATDGSGNTATCSFNVNVTANGTVTINIQQLGLTAPSITRCIKVKANSAASSLEGNYDVLFLNGVGTLTLPFDCNTNITCLSVEDPLHTLAKRISLPADAAYVPQGKPYWTFNFLGFPGKGLILGDILNDGWINAGDFGLWVVRLNLLYTDPNTPCTWASTAPPALQPPYHADLDGNGSPVVGNDFALLQGNFNTPGDIHCRESQPRENITAYTYADLIAAGAAEAILADLNRDGVLDQGDMDAFAHGAQPMLRGDVNGDGTRSFADVDAMVTALAGEATFYEVYPKGFWYTADCNSDGRIDFYDIDAFVTLLGQ